VLLIWSKGRLGNQLFQLHAVEAFRKKRTLTLLFGFQDISAEFLPTLSRRIAPGKVLTKKRLFKLERLLRELARKRVLWSISFGPRGYSHVPGILPVSVLFEEWFTSNLSVNSGTSPLTEKLRTAADSWRPSLAQLDPRTATNPICFVHIRRGDFLTIPSEAPYALPLDWFIEQMNYISARVPQTLFVVCSDDPDWVQNMLPSGERTIFPRRTPMEEFLIMSSCDSGILSASTFSWWAAKVSSMTSAGRYIAPAGWTNWRGSRNSEEEIPCTFLTYRAVKPEH
jgi:hypothetical protein